MAPSKKRPRETLDSVLARPWCYYCDRDFDDLKILHDHQKAKHFHCTVHNCHRRLNTAGGLRVHLQQVHKEELPAVPNAMDGREDPNVEIFGLEGVPQALIDARISYVTRRYNRMEADHRQRTGNPLPGTGGTHENKRPKMESKEELKARVAALKAKKAAEKAAQAAGGPPPSNGNNNANGQGSPLAFPQDTPTPPSMQGFGVPPAYQPTPPGVQGFGTPPAFQPARSFSGTPVSSTFNNLPPGLPIAPFSQAPGLGYVVPPSSSPLPVKHGNGLPFSPHANLPALPTRPSYSPAPLGASNPPGYTPHGRGIATPALNHVANQNGQTTLPPVTTPAAAPVPSSQEFENLLDWASQNAQQVGERLSASTPKEAAQPHITRSEEPSKWEAYQRNLAQLEEPRQQTMSTKQSDTVTAPEALRVPVVAPTPKPEVKPDLRNKQMLNNNVVSWEEKKAQSPRYASKARPTAKATVTGTPGISGPAGMTLSTELK